MALEMDIGQATQCCRWVEDVTVPRRRNFIVFDQEIRGQRRDQGINVRAEQGWSGLAVAAQAKVIGTIPVLVRRKRNLGARDRLGGELSIFVQAAKKPPQECVDGRAVASEVAENRANLQDIRRG